MKFYFISGIPGSGKSTASKILAKQLDIYHALSTDCIRAMIQRYHTQEDCPVLFESTYNAYKHAPEGTENPVLWGFFKQAELLKPAIKGLFKRQVDEKEDLVLEGVHLVPGYYHVPKEVEFHHILLVMTDREKYRNQILCQNRDGAEEKAKAIDYCLEFQDFLIERAKEFNKFHEETQGKNSRDSRPVTIIENNGTIEELIDQILTKTNLRNRTSGDRK